MDVPKLKKAGLPLDELAGKVSVWQVSPTSRWHFSSGCARGNGRLTTVDLRTATNSKVCTQCGHHAPKQNWVRRAGELADAHLLVRDLLGNQSAAVRARHRLSFGEFLGKNISVLAWLEMLCDHIEQDLAGFPGLGAEVHEWARNHTLPLVHRALDAEHATLPGFDIADPDVLARAYATRELLDACALTPTYDLPHSPVLALYGGRRSHVRGCDAILTAAFSTFTRDYLTHGNSARAHRSALDAGARVAADTDIPSIPALPHTAGALDEVTACATATGVNPSEVTLGEVATFTWRRAAHATLDDLLHDLESRLGAAATNAAPRWELGWLPARHLWRHDQPLGRYLALQFRIATFADRCLLAAPEGLVSVLLPNLAGYRIPGYQPVGRFPDPGTGWAPLGQLDAGSRRRPARGPQAEKAVSTLVAAARLAEGGMRWSQAYAACEAALDPMTEHQDGSAA